MPNPANASLDLSKIILKACEYDPEKRYQRATDMKNDLLDLLTKEKESVGYGSDVSVNRNETSVESNNTVGNFTKVPASNKTIPSDVVDITMGIFSGVVPQTVPSDQSEPAVDKEETVGLFSGAAPQNKVLNSQEDASNEKTALKPGKSSKSYGLMLFFVLFPYTGMFGIYNFYLGRVGLGFFKLCTINFCLVCWIIDIIKVIRGKYEDRDGLCVKRG